MKKTLKWFTLIEMLIVIVIIGILAAVLLPKIGWAKSKAEDVAITATVKNLWTAILQYEMDNADYPATLATIWDDSSLSEKYGVTKPTNTWDYTYKMVSRTHFIVCGKYSSNNNWWNMADGSQTTLDALTGWSFPVATASTGNYFCYQG